MTTWLYEQWIWVCAHWEEAFLPATWSNWALVLVGAAAAYAALKTLRAIEEQATIAKKTLVLQFRPKITVRKILIMEGTMIPTAGVPDAHPWQVKFEISNSGGSQANIKAIKFSIKRWKKDSLSFVPNADVLKQEPFTLTPGEEKTLSIDLGDDLTQILRLVEDDGLSQGYQGTNLIFFWGSVKYVDDIGIARNASVYRKYNNRTQTFEFTDSTDLEYQD